MEQIKKCGKKNFEKIFHSTFVEGAEKNIKKSVW